MTQPESHPLANRVKSIDAYRGLVMLAMASSGFAFPILAKPENQQKLADLGLGAVPARCWEFLAYQFDHVLWTGCGFWDLIQPSFMFLVGVSLPYSYSRRVNQGESAVRRVSHMLWRSFVLVALGVFLTSNSSAFTQTNFKFTNVLAQIGLGYPVLYLFRERSLRTQLAAAAIILVGYWAWFASYSIPAAESDAVQTLLADRVTDAEKNKRPPPIEPQPLVGFGSRWDKHVNAAAGLDRQFLNWFPRQEEPFRGQNFWIEPGGYQTFNFIPSLATMLFGLMAGTVLRSDRFDADKFRWLLRAGTICFVVSMLLDTSIWPIAVAGCDWHLSPIVKRIWSPGWAVFSSGWTFWMLAAFYWLIDIRQWQRWSWPLVIVGMNSIAMYLMAQLLKPWVGSSLKRHLVTVDALFGWKHGLSDALFGNDCPLSPVLNHAAIVLVLWLICWWMYRRKIFLRV